MASCDSNTCVFEHLEPRLLLSDMSVTAELFASAQLLDIAPVGSTAISKEITASGQTHAYRLTAPARGKFSVEMAVDSGTIDPRLQIFNEKFRRIKKNDNASRGTLNSSTRFTVTSGKSYYILASAAIGTFGGYRLTVTSDPRDDFGNSIETGKDKRLSSRRGSGRFGGTINYGQDVDVFRIVATQSGLMRISQTAPGRRNTLQGKLLAYDANNGLLASSTQANGSISFDVVKGQVYYLKAAALGGSTGRYRINIQPTVLHLFTAAAELNVSPAGSINISGNRAPATAVDGYKFTAAASGSAYIHMVADDGSDIDPYLRVFNSKTRRIARNNNASRKTTDSRVKFRLKAGRTYYVEAGTADDTSGAYRLILTSVPVDDIGNSFAAAKTVRLNKRGSGRASGKINYAIDVDVLGMVARKTGTMRLQMYAVGRRSDLACDISAYNAEGELLTLEQDGGEVSFDVVEGWTYYLKASSTDGSTGRYRIRLGTEEKVVLPPAPPENALVPQDIVTTEVLSLPSGLQLLVFGTDLSETISLTQSSGSMMLETLSGSYSLDGSFTSVVVYGFAGDDVIRLDNTVTAASWVYGGFGDDTIFEAGPGAAMLYGEAGDDLLVSVGGGSDTLFGGEGLDSFWLDGTDTIADVSVSEALGRTVHTIGEFYQPYTDANSQPSYVSLEIAGQELADPELTPYAGGYANFASRPLFADGAQYDDIVQGSVGDCYFMASLASLANTDPGIVEQMIAPLGDGTFAVRFYRGGKEVYLRIDADLPVSRYNGGALAYAKFGPDGELWVPLAEKAYAYFRRGENSYYSISGGWMADVYREVTNNSTRLFWTSSPVSRLYEYFNTALAEGHAVTLGSYYYASAPIVGSHAYVVQSVQKVEDEMFVTIYNPWGVDGHNWDDNYNDGLLTISIAQVQELFFAGVISMA